MEDSIETLKARNKQFCEEYNHLADRYDALWEYLVDRGYNPYEILDDAGFDVSGELQYGN